MKEQNLTIAQFMGVKIVERNSEEAVYCFEDAAYPEYFRCTKHNSYKFYNDTENYLLNKFVANSNN